MEIRFTSTADKDLKYWKETKNESVLKRIRVLLESIRQYPYSGIGSPEKLKYELSGKMSRRINQQHRIIYEVYENYLLVHSLRGHY
jgi:toxin YoeB